MVAKLRGKSEIIWDYVTEGICLYMSLAFRSYMHYTFAAALFCMSFLIQVLNMSVTPQCHCKLLLFLHVNLMYPHFNFKVKHFWEHTGPWSKGTVRSVPELWSGDWEPAYPIPQAQCLSQEPAELHHREASRWPLWWPGLTQAAQRLPHLRGGPHRSSQEPAGLAGQVGVTSQLRGLRLMHRNIPVLLDLE